jgi:hypothetical protein
MVWDEQAGEEKTVGAEEFENVPVADILKVLEWLEGFGGLWERQADQLCRGCDPFESSRARVEFFLRVQRGEKDDPLGRERPKGWRINHPTPDEVLRIGQALQVHWTSTSRLWLGTIVTPDGSLDARHEGSLWCYAWRDETERAQDAMYAMAPRTFALWDLATRDDVSMLRPIGPIRAAALRSAQ